MGHERAPDRPWRTQSRRSSSRSTAKPASSRRRPTSFSSRPCARPSRSSRSRPAARRSGNAARCLMLFDGQPKLACAVRSEQVQGRVDHDPRRRLRQRAAPLRRRLPGGRRPAMRVLHARARAAHQVDHRPGRAAVARRDREAARRAPLPLHRLREDPRRGRTDPGRQARRRRAAGGRRGRRGRQAAPALPGRRAGARRRARSSPTSTRPACSTARSSCRRMRARGSLRIDVSKALALPGVAAVATAADVPGDRWVGQIYADWPVLRRRRRGGALCRRRAGGGRRRDAAPRPRGGRAGRGRIRAAARRCSTPPRRSSPARRRSIRSTATCSSTTRYARGDVEAALAASAHVVSGEWTTQRIEHLFLEPEACLAEPLPDGRLHV